MDFSFLQGTSDISATPSITFAGQNLGIGATDRYIVVGVSSRKSGATASSIVSVTVGGISATEIIQRTNTLTDSSITGLFIALVPTGISGAIVVTFDSIQSRSGVVLYRATGMYPTATFLSSSSADNPSGIITSLTNGTIIGVITGSTPTAATWVGAQKDYDTTISSDGRMSSASVNKLGQQEGRTISSTLSGTENVGVFAAFRPANQGQFFTLFS